MAALHVDHLELGVVWLFGVELDLEMATFFHHVSSQKKTAVEVFQHISSIHFEGPVTKNHMSKTCPKYGDLEGPGGGPRRP